MNLPALAVLLTLGSPDLPDMTKHGVQRAALPESPTLDECLRLAVAHSPVLRAVREQIREQEGVDIEVRAADLPALGAYGGASYTDDGRMESFGPTISPNQEAWHAGARVTYNIYAGGAVTAQRAGQEQRIAAARAGFENALAETLLRVRADFFAAHLARKRILVREEAVQLNEQQLKLARNRLESGAGSQFEVTRAEVALANSRPPLLRSREDQFLAVDQLRQSMGVVFSAGKGPGDIVLQGGDWVIPTGEFDLEELMARALAARADLARAGADLNAARHAVDAARAGNRPRVDLYGDYGFRGRSFGSSGGDLHGYEVGAQVSWALWDADLTRGRIQQAGARVAQVEAVMENLEAAITQEVRTAHSNWRVSKEILRTSDEVIRQAQEALRLAQARFEAGAGTQIDVLSSQLELIQARLEKDLAAHNLLVAVAQLRRAAGDTTIP